MLTDQDKQNMLMMFTECIILTTEHPDTDEENNVYVPPEPYQGKNFYFLYALTDTVFDSIKNEMFINDPDGNVMSGLTFPAGALISGKFREIQLASGTVILGLTPQQKVDH